MDVGVSIRLVDRMAVFEACVSRAQAVDATSRYVHDGVGTMNVLMVDPAVVVCQNRRFELAARSYAVVPGVAELRGGVGVVIIDRAHSGLFHVGGAVDRRGVCNTLTVAATR